jgi:low affinity Fe/Cu permease
MMHFVHAWNQAVEDSLNGNFDSVKMRMKFEKMEEKINYLINVVKEQEEELGLIKKRNSAIDHGQLWLKRNIDDSPSNDEGTIIIN